MLMPIWTPPTPPLSDGDIDPYMESGFAFMYEPFPLDESELPSQFEDEPELETQPPLKPNQAEPVVNIVSTTPTDTVNSAVEPLLIPVTTPPRPSSKETVVTSNRSPSARFTKSYRQKSVTEVKGRRDSRRPVSPLEQKSSDFPEWNTVEDLALLSIIMDSQRLPYSIVTSSASSSNCVHTPNWDFVSEWVSASCGHYRSPRQCSQRYQHVILPREDTRLTLSSSTMHDSVGSKARPSNGHDSARFKKGRLRTQQQLLQDGGKIFSVLANRRIDLFSNAAELRRVDCRRPRFGIVNAVNSSKSADKHAQFLAGFGVNHDSTLTPARLAELREERLRERQKMQLHQQQNQYSSRTVCQAADVMTTGYDRASVTSIELQQQNAQTNQGRTLPSARSFLTVQSGPMATASGHVVSGSNSGFQQRLSSTSMSSVSGNSSTSGRLVGAQLLSPGGGSLPVPGYYRPLIPQSPLVKTSQRLSGTAALASPSILTSTSSLQFSATGPSRISLAVDPGLVSSGSSSADSAMLGAVVVQSSVQSPDFASLTKQHQPTARYQTSQFRQKLPISHTGAPAVVSKPPSISQVHVINPQPVRFSAGQTYGAMHSFKQTGTSQTIIAQQLINRTSSPVSSQRQSLKSIPSIGMIMSAPALVPRTESIASADPVSSVSTSAQQTQSR
ncbi:unnamed protein product [Soboliphyme baturini]|uniref:Myb-like domain-containing protein n=1 Tax=Soboliphyme baturini TaxID=241478 RepID=A0A183IC96_9BILA|nr:unnamed protein product [Soboliphyme baturini]